MNKLVKGLVQSRARVHIAYFSIKTEARARKDAMFCSGCLNGTSSLISQCPCDSSCKALSSLLKVFKNFYLNK